MDKALRHLFIEIEKTKDGYSATLSDDSIDRDGEFFAPQLMDKWASNTSALPMLANHTNEMESWIGGWTNPQVADENGQHSLKMTPNFFSESANPKAQQIKRQIDEAATMGLRTGVSIGFIPLAGQDTAKGYMHTDAEIVEGSMVPVQSNRNAGVSLAKSLRLNGRFKKTMDTHKAGDIVMAPNDNPQAGGNASAMTPEQMVAAFPAMQEQVGKMDARLAALEQAQQGAAATPAKIAELEAKHVEAEKKIADLLTKQTAQKKEIDVVNEKLAQPKGKVPSSMLNPSGVSKETETKAEKFDATKAWAEKNGYPAE